MGLLLLRRHISLSSICHQGCHSVMSGFLPLLPLAPLLTRISVPPLPFTTIASLPLLLTHPPVAPVLPLPTFLVSLTLRFPFVPLSSPPPRSLVSYLSFLLCRNQSLFNGWCFAVWRSHLLHSAGVLSGATSCSCRLPRTVCQVTAAHLPCASASLW